MPAGQRFRLHLEVEKGLRGAPQGKISKEKMASLKNKAGVFFWMRDGFFESLKNAGLSLLGGRHGHFRFVQ